MFQRGRKNRDTYEEHFMSPANGREVTFHRVVNVVEKRNPMSRMGGDFDRRGYDGVPMYNEPMPYQNPRDCPGNNIFPMNDMHYSENEDHRFANFHRNAPPQRHDEQPPHFSYNRDDLRHHLESRNNTRGGSFFRNRGRDPAREDIDYRRRDPFAHGRDRSPVRRGTHSSSSGSRPAEKNHSSQQKPKPAAPASPPPPKSPQEEPPHTITTSKESPPGSVAEPEEEVEAASVEPEPIPEPTPEPDLKARRLEAIKTKALEIEKDYRQDCETFRTVVKMLVEKEPSLDYLLQAPLEKNLEELKERCLDSLKQFIKELDEAIEQPSATDQPTEGET